MRGKRMVLHEAWGVNNPAMKRNMKLKPDIKFFFAVSWFKFLQNVEFQLSIAFYI